MSAKDAGIAMGRGGGFGSTGSAAAAGGRGGYDDVEATFGGGVGGVDVVGTCDTAVRLGFLRKVYTLLTLNFAVTVAVACFFSLVPGVRNFVVANPWLYILGIVLGFGAFLALACIKVKPPTNMVLLAAFVAGFSLMIGVICAQYFVRGWGRVVLQAFLATTAIFVSITAYIFVTKKDFSYMGGFLLAALISLLVLSLITFFTAFFAPGAARWMYFAVSFLGSLVMTGFLLYDTSIVVNKLGPDDWIIAVIMLYTDVINLFMYLLSLLSFLNQ